MQYTNILCFGDSITRGSGSNCGGWVQRLRLEFEGDKDAGACAVYNLGIMGEIVSETAGRIDWEARRRIDKDERLILVLAVGINDVYHKTPINKFEHDVVTLINTARTLTKHVVYVGLTAVDETLPMFKNFNTRAKEYDSAIARACKMNGVLYIPMFDVLQPHDMPDGIHPNTKGYQKMYERILPNLKGIF